MPQIRKVPFDGVLRDAVEVSFETNKEPWSEYALADGGHVRVKTVVRRIYRVLTDDGTPASDDNGDPSIVIESQNTVTSSPE